MKRVETNFAGRPLKIESGRLAKQAAGSCLLQFGETVVLAAVTVSENVANLPYFPLTVEYREKTYAAGKIPGGFLKREGRPSDDEVTSARVIDRSVRPLFPEGFRLDIQVVSTVLSVDQENDPTILSINGASTAIVISDVPWAGPVGAVRMGLLDGKVVVNPPMSRMAESELDLVVAGTADAILMVEAGAKGVSEQTVLEALDMARLAINEICAGQTVTFATTTAISPAGRVAWSFPGGTPGAASGPGPIAGGSGFLVRMGRPGSGEPPGPGPCRSIVELRQYPLAFRSAGGSNRAGRGI